MEPDSINLKKLILILWSNKLLIAIGTSFVAIIAVTFSLSIPDKYQSEAILTPTLSPSGGGRIPSSLNNVASLTGIDLSGGHGEDKAELAIAIMNSNNFQLDFIKKHGLEADLIAVERWDKNLNKLIYDDSVYDSEKGVWSECVEDNCSGPSAQEARARLKELLSISRNDENGLVSIKIVHFSPYIAKRWVDSFVADINDKMKARDNEQAKKTISYLESQLDSTTVSVLQDMIFQLIEEQTKKLMLTETHDEYVLSTIDKAIVSEKRSYPSRAVLVVLLTFLGGMFFVTLVLFKEYMKNDQG